MQNSEESALFDQLNELEAIADWREEESEKAVYKGVKLKDLYPLNYLHERTLFFEKHEQHNPYFSYKTIVAPDPLTLHTEYEELALKILANNSYCPPTVPNFSENEVLQIIDAYLTPLGLNDYIRIKFEANCLSRSSVLFYKEKIILKMRLPLQYNLISLEGVLNHEIGTHVIRALNHKENCLRKPTEASKLIEEGLAVINQLLPEEKPVLFKAALRYVAAILASKSSFSDLYKQLNKHIKDKEDCWRETVRSKRGFTNTEKPGGNYKDQTYFIGAIELLNQRHNIDFRKIYFGRVSPLESANFSTGVLPPFISTEEKYKHYLKRLDAIALYNFID